MVQLRKLKLENWLVIVWGFIGSLAMMILMYSCCNNDYYTNSNSSLIYFNSKNLHSEKLDDNFESKVSDSNINRETISLTNSCLQSKIPTSNKIRICEWC